MRSGLVERNRIIPANDGVVEQVQAQAQTIAAQRIALLRDVVVRGAVEIERLVLRPRRADVVEKEAVERWQRDRQYTELEPTHEREAQLGICDRDAAAE